MTIESLYAEFLKSEGICTDTRKEVNGKIFFALRGDQFDGNRFIPDALEKGCRLAIAETREFSSDSRVVGVPSTLDTLQKLAHHHRIQVAPRVLAITGSNGKTTTKEMVASVLSRKYKVLATRGNLNNHIGVPLTLLQLKDEEVAVVEMGANHAGEIRLLSEIAEPDLGMITNVGKAHLEGFGSLDAVLDAKGELYEFLAETEGKAFVDGRDQQLLNKAFETGVKTLVIGQDGELAVTGQIVKQTPFLEAELSINGMKYQLTSGLVGSYNLQNILLTTGIGLHFGIPAGSVLEAISSYVPENQRSQFIEGKRNRLILDAYNANPTSMREAIQGLQDYASPPIMLILGDMAELGEYASEEHAALVSWIKTLSIERIVLVGELFSQVCEPSGHLDVFRERTDLEAYLEKSQPEGYHILIKGSRVMELERVVKLLVD